MRLKLIKLQGFKSFVDPTTASFPSNMCAVVGPNGCGKSNIIDAVRWVMGESSAKSLRGESMTDVIFNGSVNRQPVGQASIELVFDNHDGSVGGEYARYSEIAIKRLVTREGQSEYFLNGSRCRRRDITDIFLGTGLGPRSYAIIEQGMISRLIESKPEELRVFIEEAAGISKYKERRKETENRMRRTLDNLDRLTDLREEMERQLQHLQRQAAAAEKYAAFKQEERELSGQLLALRWREFDEQLRTATSAIGELEVELEAVNADHRRIDAAIEEQRESHTELNDQFNNVQSQFYAVGSEVARMEQTITHQRERAAQLSSDLAQTLQNLEQARETLQTDESRLMEWQEESSQLTPELELLSAARENSGETLQQAEEAMQLWQQQWDEFNQGAAKPRQQAEVQQSRIQHMEQSLARVGRRRSQMEQELAEMPVVEADTELESLRENMMMLEEGMGELEMRAESLSSEVTEVRETHASQGRQIDNARTELARLEGRQASLEALQQAARESDGQAEMESWLTQQGLANQPRLLEHIEVEPHWQSAVETVLGSDLNAVCVDRFESWAAQLPALEQGALLLMTQGSEQGDGTTLASKVTRGKAWVAARLATILTADTLTEALSRREQLADQQSLITPEGIWIGRNWIRISKAVSEEGSVIARQMQLDELVETLSMQHEQADKLEADREQSANRLLTLEEQRQDNQKELQRMTREHAELNSQVSARMARIEQINSRRNHLTADIAEVVEQFSQEQAGIAEARQLLSEAIELMEADSNQREQLLTKRDEVNDALNNARASARQDQDASHQLEMRCRSLDTQITAMTQTLTRTREQVTQLQQRHDQLNDALAQDESPESDLQEQLEELLEQRLLVEGQLTEARQKVADVAHQLREDETRRTSVEHKSIEVRNKLEAQRLAQQRLTVECENITEQVKAAEQDLAAVLESIPEEATESAWREQIEKVMARINRLGPINLAAIDEYEQQSERKRYLDSQNDDLESALATLEGAIRKIDKETRERFSDTFERVNSGLQALFPKVFGGGSATLELTGDDLLDTGVSIMARPPGKKNSTIHLLSGGEKALTAIALVFSIFQLNPAPFCILDEVDAPLDDANVGRYARMVKEMSEKVQFIYITHNKISMELADQLLGVTMHEPGVSRLVTVDVEEAAELAAS